MLKGKETPPPPLPDPSLQRPRLRDSPVSSQKLLCTYGLPPRLKKTSTQREYGLICFFHITGSRDSLPEPSVIFSALLGPGARRASRPARFSLGRQRNNALLPARRKGTGGAGAPPLGFRRRRPGTPPSRLWGLRATRHGGRRAAAGDFLSALPEPGSAVASPTCAEKAGPPEPSSRRLERPSRRAGSSPVWRRLRHARGGAATGGGRSRKRKRRSKRGVGPSCSRSLGEGEYGVRGRDGSGGGR